MGFLTDWHFEGRHARNRIPEGIDELTQAGGPWRKMSPGESRYHDNGVDLPEQKFVRPDEDSFLGLGGHEAVWDPTNKCLIEEGPFRATYNYVNPGGWKSPAGIGRNVGHLVLDVIPYWFGGTERGNEGTSFAQRLLGRPQGR